MTKLIKIILGDNMKNSIPRPLVRANQLTIVLSVLAYFITEVNLFLLIPLSFGISSLLFGFNPIMELVKLFLSKPYSKYIPEDKEEQKFNQILAVTMLSISFVASLFELMFISYLFAIFVFLAASVAMMGFCIGCYIHFKINNFIYKKNRK
jgi:hypothetical protein